MTDKINTRNKFARKICTKMEKLNNDIKLLIKVDSALKNQSGGGIADAMRKIAAIKIAQNANPAQKLDTSNIDQEITQIGTELAQNVSSIITAFRTFENDLDEINRNATMKIPVTSNEINITALDTAAKDLARITATP
jgi:hypothetical protein